VATDVANTRPNAETGINQHPGYYLTVRLADRAHTSTLVGI
jgi:hypothetical protein